MPALPTTSIYVKTFAKSDTTDAVLVVNGQKMHVNKANLCLYSDYFKTLFNSDANGKSKEIVINDVDFENFATLLSLVLPKRIEPKIGNAEKLLELADRFIMPSAKGYIELFIASSDFDKEKKLQVADKYDLDHLLDNAISLYDSKKEFKGMYDITRGYSDRTRAKLYDKFFSTYQKHL